MQTFHAIGLMSGTSLDGLDICYAQFRKENNHWKFDILKAETVSYSQTLEEQLKNSIHLSAPDLLALNAEYGFYLGKTVRDFIFRHQLTEIDLIASHGHTVFHQPERNFTLQIGDGRAIKTITELPVIYDFRSQDVIMGGNGAPLVPIGDELLFSNFDACLNLGGFSNISFKLNHQRIAFDISPVNIILNHLAQKSGLKYDEDGNLARKGKIIPALLEKLNALDFYHRPHPKSLGIEWCNEHIFPLISDLETADAMATFTEHIADQIAKTANDNKLQKILCTGGGTYNCYLIEKIKSKTTSEIIIPEKEIIEYKEALIFAFMGVLRWNNEINVFSSATGSSKDHSSGIIV